MKVIPSSAFRSALEDAGFTWFQSALDSSVNCPSRAWLENDFSVYLSTLRMPGFAEAADCDDWALFAKAMAGYANGLAGAGVGVAFAVVKITIFPGSSFNGIDGPGIHLTNAVLLDNGELVAYEPQTQTTADFKDAVDDGAVSLDWVLY
jgi:hypothetical protein